MKLTYQFKPIPEAVWFVVVAMATAVLQLIVNQATPPSDTNVFLVALGAAAARALLAALISIFTNPSATGSKR